MSYVHRLILLVKVGAYTVTKCLKFCVRSSSWLNVDKVCDTSHVLLEFCCVWVQYAWHRPEGGTLLVGREEPAAQFNPSFLPPTPSLPLSHSHSLPPSLTFLPLPLFSLSPPSSSSLHCSHLSHTSVVPVDHYADLVRGNPAGRSAPKLVKLLPAQLLSGPFGKRLKLTGI